MIAHARRWIEMKAYVEKVAPQQVRFYKQYASREQSRPVDTKDAWDRVWPIPFYSNNRATVGNRIVFEARRNGWFLDKQSVANGPEWASGGSRFEDLIAGRLPGQQTRPRTRRVPIWIRNLAQINDVILWGSDARQLYAPLKSAIGPAMAYHALMALGHEVVKPDRHVAQIVREEGFIPDLKADAFSKGRPETCFPTFAILKKIADEAGVSLREFDYYISQYGMNGGRKFDKCRIGAVEEVPSMNVYNKIV